MYPRSGVLKSAVDPQEFKGVIRTFSTIQQVSSLLILRTSYNYPSGDTEKQTRKYYTELFFSKTVTTETNILYKVIRNDILCRNTDSKSKYFEDDLIKIHEFLVDNILVVFARKVLKQIVIGSYCASFLAKSRKYQGVLAESSSTYMKRGFF